MKIKEFFTSMVKEFSKREVIGFSLLVILFALSSVVLLLKIQDGSQTSAENQGYVSYLACVADIRNELGTIAVSDKVSDACWLQAEKETGATLPRYSEKVLLENLENR